ncbi:hypothetical protein ABD92_01890 [Lysinibacillus sphaericus]|uniref:hypothetical protein n=1 Tax=Lysinibacillus sphaericus TaxID=1421 RepID=UPI0018CD4897|nr:hypothetical protein [Lysinibacillus sphaericus]MBG9708167.1 hypothetical protein [Lysinibacillus sphaericus]MBG9728745.1 hypothetical protein [Lysinibacillus sphaericus]
MKYDEKYNRFFKDESALDSFNCLPTEHTTQQDHIKLLTMLFEKCLVEGYSYIQEEEFYEIIKEHLVIHVVALPIGNVAFYKEDKKSGEMTSYGMRYYPEAIYNALNSFGLFKKGNILETILYERELQRESDKLSINEEYAPLAEEYFPIEQRELLYSEFNKGKTNIYSSFDLDMKKVMVQKSAIIQALEYYKSDDLISSYSLKKRLIHLLPTMEMYCTIHSERKVE